MGFTERLYRPFLYLHHTTQRLAPFKSGKVLVPDTWKEAVKTTIAGCMFWEQEAPDVRALRCILVDILDEQNAGKPMDIF
jgi:hypothetical protein